MLLVLAAIVYLASGSIVPDSHDTTANAYIPVSLLGDGDLAFGALEAPLMFLWKAKDAQGTTPVYVQSWAHRLPGSDITFGAAHHQGILQFAGPRYFLVRTIRTRAGSGEPLFVGAFGPVAGLTALPVMALAWLCGADLQQDAFAVFRAAKWSAALLAAGSVALVFLAAAALTTQGHALALALLYAFGSCIWTISSQALWQQTPELFFFALGALCIVRTERPWLRGAAAGLAFSAAAACRPTAAIVALVAAAYLLLSERRAAIAYLAAAAPALLGVLAYNQYYFGAPYEFGQFAAGAAIAASKTGSSELWQTPWHVGAAGLLLSPSRGLLVYSPFFAAAFVGAVLVWRDPKYERLRFLAVAVPLLWLPAFLWFDWWGGWTYGYRPIVDSTPLLALLCVPAIDRLATRAVWGAAFVAAAIWSLFVQLLGVAAYQPEEWNARTFADTSTAANIDLPQYRSRLWSLTDWQIGYLIQKCAGATSR